MKERPIIFNDAMVRAIIEGKKTQTRRIIKSPAKNMQAMGHGVITYREPGDKWYGDHVYSMRNRRGVWEDFTKEQFIAKCPFGQPGDRLWVRETFATGLCTPDTMAYRATHKQSDLEEGWFEPIKWTPSIHMPRWAARIILEITGVRVERLNDISNDDALAEGMDDGTSEAALATGWFEKPRRAFRRLWEQIYGQESWDANPWVWVIEFKLAARDGKV